MYRNEEKKPEVVLTLVMNDRTYKFESNHFDLDANDLLEAFYGLLVSQTFTPRGVAECMRDFAEEKLEVFDYEAKIYGADEEPKELIDNTDNNKKDDYED